jgi:hypothetical protein
MFVLALFGGALYRYWAVQATTVGTNGAEFPYGLNALLKGLIFTVWSDFSHRCRRGTFYWQ